MKKTKIFLLLIAMFAALTLTACGGGGGGGDGAPSGGGGPTLVSIAVTPNNQSIATGHTQQFTATGAYSDGSTQNLTSSATWSSSDNAVAGISNTGLSTAGTITAGSTTITTSSGGISGNTILKVIINLPKTGQTKCYDSNDPANEIICAGTGQDGELQKGVAWPSTRFTDNNNGTITDNLTGLIWLKRANCMSGTWNEALSYVNISDGDCGLTDGSSVGDWRLPNRKELRSLINYEQANTATWLNLPAQGFGNVRAFYYWSSSTYASFTSHVWYVGMDDGYVDGYGFNKTNTFYVWPVRAGGGGVPADLPKTGQATCYDTIGAVIACATTGQDGELQKGVAWPSPRFTDNGNGTITDNLTGLIWLKNANCANAARDWATALSDVAQLNIGGTMNSNNCGDTSNGGSYQTDWRLPNVNELESLINAEQADTAAWLNLSAQGFSNVQAYYYWSSSTYAYYTTDAWGVRMFNGSVYGGNKAVTGYVWPVRAGQ